MAIDSYVTLRNSRSLKAVEKISLDDSCDVLKLYIRAHEKCGDSISFETTDGQWWLVTDPQQIHYILVENSSNFVQTTSTNAVLKRALGSGVLTTEGQPWRRKRHEMICSFGSLQADHSLSEIHNSVAALNARWVRTSAGSIDIWQEMSRLAIDLVGRCFFRVDLRDWADDLIEAFHVINIQAFTARNAIPTSSAILRNSLLVLDRACHWILAELFRQDHPGRLPILSNGLDYAHCGGMANHEDIKSDVSTLLFTGFDTCSSLLTWTWHLLSRRPDMLDCIARESFDVYSGRVPSLDDVARFHLSGMVVDEVLRLYPPIWLFGRRSIERDSIGGCEVPAGALVLICPYVTHRHLRYWRAPDVFEPARFAAGARRAHHRFAYLPFGVGQRSCVAPSFAHFQAKLVTSLLARSFRVSAADQQAIQPLPATTLAPSQPVWAKVRVRTEATALGDP